MKRTEIRDSSISPREFQIRLHERVELRRSLLSTWSPGYLISTKRLFGTFDKTTFVLQRKTRFAHWLQPIAYGDMTPIPTGIRVHVTWRTHPGAHFFQASALMAAAVVGITRSNPAVVAALLVAAVVTPIATRVNLADSRRALENFLRPATPPAPKGTGSIARLKEKK